MAQTIIGRKAEITELQRLYGSGRPEFIVIYGRRRVGKTFLVRELLGEEFAFYHTGLSPTELANGLLINQQLMAFHSSLLRYGDKHHSPPENWLEAFSRLTALLEANHHTQRQVVFIDELPWLDTQRSGFVTALEHFWNGWGAGQPQLMLIVCGSATSWINDKLLNNHGGLYGRATSEIHLAPFSLAECEEYFAHQGITFDRYDQLQCYMVFGGIPFYLSMLRRGESLAQNIDRLFFDSYAPLHNEFERLFASLFVNADDYTKVTRLLGTKRMGFTRKEIIARTGIASGGGLSKLLDTLIACDFVSSYVNFGHTRRHTYYRLADPFCLFFLYFIDKNKTTNSSFWQNNYTSPKLNAWRGFAFETVVFCHTPQLKAALGIAAVQCEMSPWHSDSDNDGAQVDMVISRADRVVNLCEMKFSNDEFVVDAACDKALRHKAAVFASETALRATLQLTLVTTYGLAMTPHASRFQRVVTMDSLFV